MSAHQPLAIHDLLTRFFQAFDEKDWSMMRECLCDEVFTDYLSFRDRPAALISSDRYVELRRSALQSLDMQHNFLNLRVECDPDAQTAVARCNYLILRFQPSSDEGRDDFFHSCGHYVFGLAVVGRAWKICRITQHLLRNSGNREIHGATSTRVPVVGGRAFSGSR